MNSRSNTYRDLHLKGNKELLEYFKTAFFCSRDCPAPVKTRYYEWAKEQKNKGDCIISGFHSQVERDLLHALIEAGQPVIMVLARGQYKQIPDPKLKVGLNNGNLLMASPFEESVTRASKKTADKRNKLMIELADEIMVAYARPGGSISKLLRHMKQSRKLLYTIDVPENKPLIDKGFYAI